MDTNNLIILNFSSKTQISSELFARGYQSKLSHFKATTTSCIVADQGSKFEEQASEQDSEGSCMSLATAELQVR